MQSVIESYVGIQREREHLRRREEADAEKEKKIWIFKMLSFVLGVSI